VKTIDDVLAEVAGDLQRVMPRGAVPRQAGRKPNGAHVAGCVTENPEGGAKLHFICMEDVVPKPVDWLWTGRIARGKLTLFSGDPGMGKSQISCDIAARITSAAEWPDGGCAPSGSVIVLSAEDSAEDTVRPRLEAAGANLGRVVMLRAVIQNGRRRTFNLQADLDQLAAKIKEMGDVSFLVIDPITSYMGKIDAHRTTDVRVVLEPVADFASTQNVAVFSITHPPKATQSKSLHTATGSLAFMADARMAFLALKEPDTERRLFLPVKNNLGAPAPGLGYRLAQRITSGNIIASHVVWDSSPVTMTADEALRAADESLRNGGALQDAREFLREALAPGPRAMTDVEAEAQKQGIAPRTLRRAREKEKILTSKSDFDGGWVWRLPGEDGQRRARQSGQVS
jgi:putative DNA primase/helicase